MYRLVMFTAVVFCAGAFALQPALAQDHYTLEYRFVQGMTYLFADSISIKTSQEVMGQEMKSTSSVFAATRVVPSEVRSDGMTVLVISPDNMKFSLKSMQLDTTIDLQEMIGKRTRLTISKLGDFTRRDVIDTVRLAGLAASAGQRDLIRFHTYPAKPVKVGEKWSSTRPDTTEVSGSKIAIKTVFEYTLIANEQHRGIECLKISYAGTISFTGKGSAMGGTFYIEGTGKAAGTFFVDPANGLPVSEDSTTDTESTVAITGQQNMTIPSSQSIISHRTLLSD